MQVTGISVLHLVRADEVGDLEYIDIQLAASFSPALKWTVYVEKQRGIGLLVEKMNSSKDCLLCTYILMILANKQCTVNNAQY